MNKLIYIYTLALVLLGGTLQAQEDFRKNAPKGGPAPKIELKDAKSFELDNGLKVILVEDDRLPKVNFQLTIDVPAFMAGDKTGVSSITGQLMRAGTTKKSKAELDEAVDFIGAVLNVGSSGIFASSLTKHTDDLLGMMQEVLLMPSFAQEEFDKIKQQTLSALAFNQNDPNAIASRVSDVVFYGTDHPYSEFETEETIGNIALEDTKAYYNTYFKPNRSYLVIVGDIKESKAKSLAKKYFGGWEKGTVKEETFATPAAPATREVKFVDKPDAVQSVINIGYPLDLKPGHPDAIKVRVLSTILGGYFRSRLNNNIREDKGYSYGVGGSISSGRLVGNFTAGGSVRNSVTDSAIVEFLKEIELLTKEAPGEKELDLVKNVITGNFAKGMESPQSTASYALNVARYNLPKDYYKTYLTRMDALTPADILATAKKYLKPDNAYIVVVGKQDEVADKLGRFAANGEVDFLDAYGQPVKASDYAGDMDAETVIEKYIEAIGGADKLKQVKDYTITMEANIQGQALKITNIKKAPAKLSITVSVMGNVMQESKFDGEKGQATVMGQKQPIEGDAAIGMKAEAALFPELDYGDGGYYEMKVIDQVEINGEDTYVVLLTDQMDNQKKEYYSLETGLKVRAEATVSNEGQTMTTTQEFGDYKAVDGILFPHAVTTTGAMPFPLEMKVSKIEVNTDVADSVFEIK